MRGVLHEQHEDYAGEWLVKIVEHLQRFDRKEMTIPRDLPWMKYTDNEPVCEDW